MSEDREEAKEQEEYRAPCSHSKWIELERYIVHDRARGKSYTVIVRQCLRCLVVWTDSEDM